MQVKEKGSKESNSLLNIFRYSESERFMKLVKKYPLSFVEIKLKEEDVILIAEEISKVLKNALGIKDEKDEIEIDLKNLSKLLKKEKKWLSDADSIIHVYNELGNASLVYHFPITKKEVDKLKQNFYCDYPDPDFICLEQPVQGARLDGDICAKFEIIYDTEHKLLEIAFRAYSKTYDEEAINKIYENLKRIDKIIGEREISISKIYFPRN